MNRLLIILTIVLFVGCKSESFVNQTHSKSRTPNVILDTLVFDQNMNGKLLTEKYAFGDDKLKFYKPFVSVNNINEKKILTEKTTKTEITYLGELLDLDKNNIYHIITNFKIIGIGEMDSPRGQSYIVFLDKYLDKAIIYRMNLPDELPEKIENNILYFTLKTQNVGISISGGLPPMLCLPKIGCY